MILSKLRPITVGTIGICCALLLGAIWTRGERLLGNDSWGYLELAKQYRTTPPTHLGDWWPFGFPGLGALVSLSGLSIYVSLVVVSAAAIFAIIVGYWSFLPDSCKESPAALMVLLAAVCAPVCPLLVYGLMSEPLFSAALFGLALSISCWPSRAAIIAAMVLATMAFTIRYVGACGYGVIAVCAALSWSQFKQARRLLFLLFSYV